jgi:hypothetical protein
LRSREKHRHQREKKERSRDCKREIGRTSVSMMVVVFASSCALSVLFAKAAFSSSFARFVLILPYTVVFTVMLERCQNCVTAMWNAVLIGQVKPVYRSTRDCVEGDKEKERKREERK